jgi:hypothetical protein
MLRRLHSRANTIVRFTQTQAKTRSTFYWITVPNLVKATILFGLSTPIFYVAGTFLSEYLNKSNDELFDKNLENGRINIPFLQETCIQLIQNSNDDIHKLLGDKFEVNSKPTVHIEKSKGLITNVCRVTSKELKTAQCDVVFGHFQATIAVYLPVSTPKGNIYAKCILLTGDVQNGTYQVDVAYVELLTKEEGIPPLENPIQGLTKPIPLYQAPEPPCDIAARQVLLINKKDKIVL